MRIIKSARLRDGNEIKLSLKDQVCWQGFVLTGLPPKHDQHENKPKTLSAAVTIWNRVTSVQDRITAQEISAKITANHNLH